MKSKYFNVFTWKLIIRSVVDQFSAWICEIILHFQVVKGPTSRRAALRTLAVRSGYLDTPALMKDRGRALEASS